MQFSSAEISIKDIPKVMLSIFFPEKLHQIQEAKQLDRASFQLHNTSFSSFHNSNAVADTVYLTLTQMWLYTVVTVEKCYLLPNCTHIHCLVSVNIQQTLMNIEGCNSIKHLSFICTFSVRRQRKLWIYQQEALTSIGVYHQLMLWINISTLHTFIIIVYVSCLIEIHFFIFSSGR